MRPTHHLAALATAALIVVGCSKAEAPEAVTAVKPAKLVTVTAASLTRDLTFPAVIRAVQSAELTFQLPGEIIELTVLEGEEIKKGTVIAKLDQRDARNSLVQAEAQFQNAESEYRRAQRLVEQDAISRSVLEARQTEVEVSQAAVATARKALADTTIRAPFDGSVSRVYVEQFQNVQAKEAIATLQTNATEAIVDIPGTIVARIPQLEPVGSRVILDAAPNVEIPATFREASGIADEATQTYKISFLFEPPPDLFILPGMTAVVRTTFKFGGAEDVFASGIAVPVDAVLAEGDNRYVWVVGDDMRIEKRTVTVGSDVDATVTVTSGLSDGETIVAAGVSFLNEGMVVSAWCQSSTHESC